MRYARPETLEEAVSELASGEATVIGGGTMIVPDMTHGKVRPEAVVDLSAAGLAGYERRPDGWTVGSMTTYAELERSPVPLLAVVASKITGGPQIRHRGSVGGSACYANPASDVPGVLVALGAMMRLVSAAGVRDVPAQEFFIGPFQTSRRPDEVLQALLLPRVDGPVGYSKFKISESSWPIVTASTVAEEALTIVVGGAARVPVRLEIDRPGRGVHDDDWQDHLTHVVGRALEEAGGGWDDALAPGEYRVRIAPVIATRSVADALGVE